MLNVDFLDKGLGIVAPAHFVYDFSTKMLLTFYSIFYSSLCSLSELAALKQNIKNTEKSEGLKVLISMFFKMINFVTITLAFPQI